MGPTAKAGLPTALPLEELLSVPQCNCPGRNESAIVPKKFKFPLTVLRWEKKKAEGWCRQEEAPASEEEIQHPLTIWQTTLQDRQTEARMVSSARPHSDQDSSVRVSVPLFK